ncbi:hypothetical protein EVAR_94515_1 [Eumeta japonica]|uniref:Uncharacterized protein n=1 Tax=Eumeta variegata TaxID=151549 RepID=A0A4C1UW10_EUMVA|nr:hypothetical protein EVAR_94515_1 [Eumeta japonica]
MRIPLHEFEENGSLSYFYKFLFNLSCCGFFNHNLCSLYVQADAPSINCIGISASVAVVLRPPLVKLVLQKTSLNIETLSIILPTQLKNPYFEATLKENPKCGRTWRY